MDIIQKFKLDEELTNNIRITLRDETGLYNPSNITGYGGPNGNQVSRFDRYVFKLVNLYTNEVHTQIQNDVLSDSNAVHNPSLDRIVNKENIYIHANHFNLLNFNDGLYRLSISLDLKTVYEGDGFVGSDVVLNVPGAGHIFKQNNAISIDDDVYIIRSVSNDKLILDRPVTKGFFIFKSVLLTSIDFIISDTLNDNINCTIANISKKCDSNNTTIINSLSEIQLYYWAMQRCIKVNDINQAYEYLKTAKDLSNHLKPY